LIAREARPDPRALADEAIDLDHLQIH
jgi:hypothetical protein